MRIGRVVTVLAIVLALSGASRSGVGEESAIVERRPLPVHADAAELESALVDTVRALVRSDLVAARAALDRMEAGCRRLRPDEASPHPESVAANDRAFHATLDKAREFALRGAEDRAFEQLYWIEKACLQCHEAAPTENLPGLPTPRVPALPEASTPGSR